ncbi:MAG: hypothetical protein KF872_06860 [Chitinophagales bacterium]|nr:hypothetical protein [Chitinophagales bacterium]
MKILSVKNAPIFIAGVVGFGVLLFLSVYFLWERVLFLDFSFYMFEMIRNAAFYHPGNRFVALVNQAPALLAVKAQLPLTQVLQIHSVSFPMFHFVVFILLLLLKEQALALALLLFNILLASDAFYWCESEFPQGVGLIFLFLALIKKDSASISQKVVWILLAVLLMVTAIWAHPLVFLPFGFMLLYFFVQKEIPMYQTLAWGVILALAVVFRFIQASMNWYEAGKIGSGMDGLRLLPQFFSLPIVLKSLPWFVKDYWIFSFLGIATAIVLVVKKQWLKVALCLCYVAGYYVLVCISNPFSDKFYVENLWVPMSIGVALPFAYELFPLLGNNVVRTIVLLLIVSLRSITIFNAHHHFTERKIWWSHAVEAARQAGGQKFIISAYNAPMEVIHHTFSTAYESMLYTAAAAPSQVVCIGIDYNPKAKEHLLQEQNRIVTEYGTIEYTAINPVYFKFKDGPTRFLELH